MVYRFQINFLLTGKTIGYPWGIHHDVYMFVKKCHGKKHMKMIKIQLMVPICSELIRIITIDGLRMCSIPTIHFRDLRKFVHG